MTMTENLRVKLYRAVQDLRGHGQGVLAEDWSADEIGAALLKLKADPRHPRDLWLQAISAAFDLSNQRASKILDAPQSPEPVYPISPPKVVTEWCPTHCVDSRLRTDGERACCWSDRVTANLEPPQIRKPHPCPESVRVRVRAEMKDEK